MATYKTQWHKSNLDGPIDYRVDHNEDGSVFGKNHSIAEVVFNRFNKEAGVTENVHVHWSQAFKWADFDPCGGLGLSAVIWEDGTKTFASGLYFRDGGLAKVVVGCYGTEWISRPCKPERDPHGFPVVTKTAG